MHKSTFLRFALALSIIRTSSASPVALPQGTGNGADSCPTDLLTADTWTKLDIDKFLKDWSASNVTVATSNNVQSLADSFGAPNFFCGLDNFCNAGQPCLPVDLPAWYAMVAIQNWNSYMNSMNTAISFASSIVGLTLPGIVADFYPKPEDDITPLKTMASIFTTVLGVVPFTGPIATANVALTSSLGFVIARIKPPVRDDLFLKWSSVSTSLATVVTDYQSVVSTFIKATLDAPVDKPDAGINSIIASGAFLGVAQNFTQADLQSQVTDSINMFAISLVLQARKIFISRENSFGCETKENDMVSEICAKGPKRDDTKYIMLKDDGNGNAQPQNDVVELLMSKYGLTKEEILIAPANCLDANGGKQVANPFNGSLPLDPKTQCLFNVAVCDRDNTFPSNTGIVEGCRDKGLEI